MKATLAIKIHVFFDWCAMRISYLLGCLFFWSVGSTFAIAQEATKPASSIGHDTMIVLDASGSMWGQIDGEAKISIAKTVVGDVLVDWDRDTGLGLIAYGHRREGDCGDIETIVPVAKETAAAVSTKVKSLNPKGKTPITESMRQAAKALNYTESGATVILVSDGLETCNADPCALAKELEAEGIDFTAHIIGFGLKEEEFKALQCIATETGGQYFTANTADELAGAFLTTVKAAKAAGNLGLQVYSAACEECDPYKNVSFIWSVFQVDDEDNKTGQAVATGVTQGFLANVKPGRYFLEGTLDHNSNIAAHKIIEVYDDRATKVTLVVPAGRVGVSAISNADGPAIKSDMLYRFLGLEDEEGKRVEYAVSASPTDSLWLPTGEYLVEATHGKAKVSDNFVVAPDEQTDLTLDMKVGYLKVSARLSESEELLNGSNIWVNQDESSASFNNKIDYVTHRKVATFILSEGDYIATSESGNARGAIQASVIAGETSEVTVTINAGRANLKAGYVEGEPVNGVGWEIRDSDGKRVALGSNQANFTLNEGAYTAIVAKNYKTAGRTDFVVNTGEVSEVFFILPKLEE